MATISDYIVFADNASTLVLSSGAGPQGEKTFSATLPASIELNSSNQRPILMFKARTNNGSMNVEVDVNSTNELGLSNFKTEAEQTVHEVVNGQLFQPSVQNHIRFRVVGGDPQASFIVSDVVLWFQRPS